MTRKALTVAEAIRTRRSIKQFNGEGVATQEVLDILDEAVWAPNHQNRQPWRVVVAAEQSLVKVHDMIRDITIPNWEHVPQEEIDKKMQKFKLAGAYAFVIVHEDLRQKERLEDYAAVSCMLQNVQLLAWDREIGTCWKTPGWLEKPQFLEQLGVKPGERVFAMLQFGHYDTVPAEKPRKSTSEFVTFL